MKFSRSVSIALFATVASSFAAGCGSDSSSGNGANTGGKASGGAAGSGGSLAGGMSSSSSGSGGIGDGGTGSGTSAEAGGATGGSEPGISLGGTSGEGEPSTGGNTGGVGEPNVSTPDATGGMAGVGGASPEAGGRLGGSGGDTPVGGTVGAGGCSSAEGCPTTGSGGSSVGGRGSGGSGSLETKADITCINYVPATDADLGNDTIHSFIWVQFLGSPNHSDYSVRYWLNPDGRTLEATVNSATVYRKGAGKLVAAKVLVTGSYVEFSVAASEMPDFGTLLIDFVIAANGPMDQTNDWSYRPEQNYNYCTKYMTGYYSKALVWGDEPSAL